ncbi:hypothetical protein KP509_03G087100 [Ceratopteris richardii]|uniref:Nicotinamide-nucleotide adenylyltransferase n=1 Tax=Ceratopteris richardii TaxID=49495 RepID=A0A8T2V1U6_CERRI|nr:hypothetical protein KP509_03G087100 [Ceratopteris richardii]KAH7442408.1 hypothetical protein KP509_03G087100 [Ceratopteris richardii]
MLNMAVDAADQEDDFQGTNIPLPNDKLRLSNHKKDANNLAVLLETGSFNPPTFMHQQMFAAGREALEMRGFFVVGCYMSPVNNAYGKQGLVPGEHRIRMCQLVAKDIPLLMVDPWEALQPTYQRTLKVLKRVKNALYGLCSHHCPIRVMLLCGADLLESFTTPGTWIPEQVEEICRDYGVVCIKRGDKDLKTLIGTSDILSKYSENIIIADKFESDISSTRVRENIAKKLPIDELTLPSVIDYIKSNGLYETC